MSDLKIDQTSDLVSPSVSDSLSPSTQNPSAVLVPLAPGDDLTLEVAAEQM